MPVEKPTSMKPPALFRRPDAGFTLIELLTVMLVIITVLGMGVPAMFSAERRSLVNSAMNDLIRVHQTCMSLQREMATRGIDGQVTLTITTSGADGPTVKVTAPGGLDLAYRFSQVTPPVPALGSTNPIAINSIGFITSVTPDPLNPLPPTITWTYEKGTGFIAGSAQTLTFQAMPVGLTFKLQRKIVFSQYGYVEVP